MNYIKDAINISLVNRDPIMKITTFKGEYDDKPILYIIKSNTIDDINKIEYIEETFNNERFYKYNFLSNNENEILILYPANNDDLKKYCSNIKIKHRESYEDYINNVYPVIINQNIDWIRNILDHKKENDNILYEDEYFVLMPDLKWDGRLDSLYCLAIVKNYNLRSIRDLKGEHIQYLKHIYKKSLDIIKHKFNTDENQLRAYFHYHPSFWHLHIHFNLIQNNTLGACIDFSHSFNTVIQNLELHSEYYQKVDLDIIKKS